MEKLNNLLSFKEYGELKQFDKGTKHTEIGGDVVNEKKKDLPQFIKDKIEAKKSKNDDGKSCGCKHKKEEKNVKVKAKGKLKNIKEFAEYSEISNEEIDFGKIGKGIVGGIKKGASEIGNVVFDRFSRKEAEDVLKKLEKIPNKKSMLEKAEKDDPNARERFLKCIMENPNEVNYIFYDLKDKVFYVGATASTSTGPGGAGFESKSKGKKY